MQSAVSRDPDVCIVTGANTGIGKETVRGLVRHGSHVIMVCRNKEKAERARDEIYQSVMQRKPGRAQTPEINIMIADLSRPPEIVSLCHMICEQYEKINALINNAGAIFSKRTVTPEGFESTFATNHLSYFLLVHHMKDVLHKTALQSSKNARIINVASEAHAQVKQRTEDWQSEKNFSGFQTYGLSKLANILFTREFARLNQNSGIVCNALHPGVIATDFGTKGGGLFGILWSLMKPFLASTEKGAGTSLFLATDPSFEGSVDASFDGLESKTGGYYIKGRLKRGSKLSRDLNDAQSLWKYTEEILAPWL